MKRILVLSDSHGNVNNMVTAVGRLHPDMIIHLGDCWADAEQLHRKFPMTVMEQVRETVIAVRKFRNGFF